MDRKGKILTVLLSILAIIVAFAVVVWIHDRDAVSSTTSTSSAISVTAGRQNPTEQLESSNKDFATAQTYASSGDYSSALTFYQKALVETSDPTLSAQIEYDIAYADIQIGNYETAITSLKQIAAANVTAWPIMSAYAAQELSNIQYFAPPAQVSAINAEVFSGTPYASFGPSATTTISEAYFNLYKYVAGIYPLGVSESRIASWYANDLLINLHGATTSQQGVQDIKAIQSSVNAATADVDRVKNQPAAVGDIPEVLSRAGLALGYLAYLGVGSPLAAEVNFENAQHFATVIGEAPGDDYVFRYAVFLELLYGKTRAADIINILAPFKAGNGANIGQDMVNTFTETGKNPGDSPITYQHCVALARIDPSFKAYLISLGWQSSDFPS